MSFRSRAFWASFLVGVLLTCCCCHKTHATKEIIDRKLGRPSDRSKIPLFSRFRRFVASNSRFAESTYPSESATLIVDDKLVPVNYDVRVPEKGVKAKATGVRVISTRPPSVDIIEPTMTAPRRSVHTCDDITPDNIYTREEQMRFGKCDAEFMVSSNHCARTCGRAPFPSVDVICRTISESVEGSQLLDFLDIVLEMTDLKVAFDDPALHVTVFAPTNVAFEELLKDLCIGADEFLDFPGVVEEILGAHVLIEPLLSSDFEDGDVLETMSELSDVEIVFGHDNSILVVPDYGLPAEILSTDLEAPGSIVHMIDTVLIPDKEILFALDRPEDVIAEYESRYMMRSDIVYQSSERLVCRVAKARGML